MGLKVEVIDGHVGGDGIRNIHGSNEPDNPEKTTSRPSPG